MENYHNKIIVFNFYLEIINLIYSGEVNSALKKLNYYRLGYPEVIGMGLDDNSINTTLLNEFYQILETKYLIKDLEIDDKKKRKILSIIAVDHLQSSFAINTHQLFLDEFMNEYDVRECTPLINFISDNPTGLFSYCEIDDDNEIAEMFFHSIINNAYNIVLLNQYLTAFPDDFLKERYKGIQIEHGDNRCDICKGKRILQFPFKKINELPELPFYPGCLCWYSLYGDEDF
jgi:hypothetical protein